MPHGSSSINCNRRSLFKRAGWNSPPRRLPPSTTAARSGYFTEAFDILNQALHGKVISEREKTTLGLLRALSTGQVGPEAGNAARLEVWLQSLLAPLE